MSGKKAKQIRKKFNQYKGRLCNEILDEYTEFIFERSFLERLKFAFVILRGKKKSETN